MDKEALYKQALEDIYDIAFTAYISGKGIGKLLNPYEKLKQISEIIDNTIPDEDEEPQ